MRQRHQDGRTIGDGATVFKLRKLDVFLKGYIYDNASRCARRAGLRQDRHPDPRQPDEYRRRASRPRRHREFRRQPAAPSPSRRQKVVVNGRPYDVVSDEVMNTLGIRLIQELANRSRTCPRSPRPRKKTPTRHRSNPLDARAPMRRVCKRQAEWGCEAERFLVRQGRPRRRRTRTAIGGAGRKPAHLPMVVEERGKLRLPSPGPEAARDRVASNAALLRALQERALPQRGAVMDQATGRSRYFAFSTT